MAQGPGRKGGHVCLQRVSFCLLEEKAQGREAEDAA